jgi:diguanylate cyclase (GGDEF)-like protein
MQQHVTSDGQHCDNCFVLEQEISALKTDLAEMEQYAYRDPLTGLSNRRNFIESLENRIARCQRYGENCALLFLDVNDLKAVNDQHGHGAGDALLVRLAEILRRQTRASDVAARIGGDEFALLLDHLDADQVENKIAYLVTQFSHENCTYAGKKLPFGAAIGYCFVGPKDTVEDLMSHADAAMYRAKISAD